MGDRRESAILPEVTSKWCIPSDCVRWDRQGHHTLSHDRHVPKLSTCESWSSKIVFRRSDKCWWRFPVARSTNMQRPSSQKSSALTGPIHSTDVLLVHSLGFMFKRFKSVCLTQCYGANATVRSTHMRRTWVSSDSGSGREWMRSSTCLALTTISEASSSLFANMHSMMN